MSNREPLSRGPVDERDMKRLEMGIGTIVNGKRTLTAKKEGNV